MIINKYNIEKWMFDYFEGNLTNHEQIEFEYFMEVNAQFEEEFDFWKKSYNTGVDVPAYEVPESLYKDSFWPFQRVASFVLLGLVLFSAGYFIYSWNEEKVEYHTMTNYTYNESIKVKEKTGEYKNKGEDCRDKSGDKITRDDNETTNFSNSNLDSSSTIKKEESETIQKQIIPKKSNRHQIKEEENSSNKRNLKKRKTATIINTSYTDEKKGVLTKRNSQNKKVKPFVYKIKNKNVLAYSYNPKKKDDKYSFLDFKRSKIKRKYKEKEEKPKQRERNYVENIAIISVLANNDKSKLRKKKRFKMFNKLKSKDIALTNTHDPIFVIYNSSPIENNIALTGGLNTTRINANFLSRRLNSFTNKNKLFLAGDTYLEKLNAGVGLIANIGDYPHLNFRQSSFGVTYSQRIQLKEESSISIGVNYKYNLIQYPTVLGGQQPLVSVQNTANGGQNNSLEGNHLFSSALWFDGKFLYGGINLDNLIYIKNKNNNANEFVESINPFKFAIQLGTDYRRSIYSVWVISPQINYRYQQNYSELWIGGVLKYKRLIAGLSGAFSNVYKVNFGVQGDKLRLIYGFDYSKSQLENQFYGTHELSLRYVLRGKNKRKK